MYELNKQLDQIKAVDLQKLVDEKILENKVIEYKAYFPSNKTENGTILEAINSFANTDGGDLILGITEKNDEKGIPENLSGVNIDGSVDQMKQKLNSLIENGILPQIIPFPEVQPVDLPNGKLAFVVRVQPSWTRPHKCRHNDRFYIRTSSGKHSMNVAELRVSFALTGTIIERIKDFRRERIGLLLSSESLSIQKDKQSKGLIVLHLVPLSAMADEKLYDLETLNKSLKKSIQFNGSQTSNLDGILEVEYNSSYYSHIQIFRRGILEYVNGNEIRDALENKCLFPKYEDKIVDMVTQWLKFLEEIGGKPPIFVFLTLLHTKGCILFYTDQYSMEWALNDEKRGFVKLPRCDRDVLFLPEQRIDNFGVSVKTILDPLFDIVCESFGVSSKKRQDVHYH